MEGNRGCSSLSGRWRTLCSSLDVPRLYSPPPSFFPSFPPSPFVLLHPASLLPPPFSPSFLPLSPDIFPPLQFFFPPAVAGRDSDRHLKVPSSILAHGKPLLVRDGRRILSSLSAEPREGQPTDAGLGRQSCGLKYGNAGTMLEGDPKCGLAKWS